MIKWIITKLLFYLVLLLFLTSCSPSISGILTDARAYHNKLMIGNKYGSADYFAKLSNLPACVMKDNGEVVYLAISSSTLSRLTAEKVKIQGKYYKQNQILYPLKIYTWQNNHWVAFNIN